MDDNRFDQDYTAPRHTQLQLGASLPPRQLSSRPRNPSPQNGLGGPTMDERLEEHLSPREFLPSLPSDSGSPRPATNQTLASVLRDPNIGETLRLQPLQLSRSQQGLPPFPLRPAQVMRVAPLDSASDATLTSRAFYRTLDIRGGLAPTPSVYSSSHSGTSRSNTSTPAWPSPGKAQAQSPDGSPQSQAVGTNRLQLSVHSGQSSDRRPSNYQSPASPLGNPSTHRASPTDMFDYGVPATIAPLTTPLSSLRPSSSSATRPPQLGQVRPREPESPSSDTTSLSHGSITTGQAMRSDHNSDVLARPSKKSRTTKSVPDHSHQIYHFKPPSQLGHYAGEAQSVVKTFKLIACALLLAKNPFPNPGQRREMFEEAWDRAKQEQPLRGSAVGLELNDDLMVLASDAQRTFRNRLKREAESAVNDMGEVFGIVPKNTIPKQEADPAAHVEAVQNNVQVSSLSHTNANLIFRQWRDPDQPRQGPFKNPAIERVLLVAFRSADVEGAKGFYLFKDQMPGEAIALACAAIDVCLEEYSQGIHRRIDFTTSSHRVVWEFYRTEWVRLRDRDLAAQDYIERLQSDLSRKAAIACGKLSTPSTLTSLPAAITHDDVLE